MAKEGFGIWYPRAVIYELGNDDDPRDPGGRTSDGITQREYDVYRARKGKTKRDVWSIGTGCKAKNPEALAEREEIFRSYWNRISGDELPTGIDFVVADASLNSGPAQAAKWLQRALKMNNVDGEIGPATKAAVLAAADHDLVVDDMCQRRLAFMMGLRTWDHFGKGWSARVANVRRIGEALASGSIPGDPVLLRQLGGAAKASPLDIKKPLVSVSTTQIATGAAGISTGIAQAVEQLQPVADKVSDVPYLRWVGTGFAIATGVGILAGIVAKIAEARAQATHDGSATTQVDDAADQIAEAVAVDAPAAA